MPVAQLPPVCCRLQSNWDHCCSCCNSHPQSQQLLRQPTAQHSAFLSGHLNPQTWLRCICGWSASQKQQQARLTAGVQLVGHQLSRTCIRVRPPVESSRSTHRPTYHSGSRSCDDFLALDLACTRSNPRLGIGLLKSAAIQSQTRLSWKGCLCFMQGLGSG